MVRKIVNEAGVVRLVEKQLTQDGRFFCNIHGGRYGKVGQPDIITADKKGLFLGIELKAPTGKVFPNQLRNAEKIIRSGGRYVVAYPDFELVNVDKKKLPKYTFTDEDMKIPKHSCEIVLKGGQSIDG